MILNYENDNNVTEAEQAHLDAANDAHQQELDENEAVEKGYCIHCGEQLADCVGYKCWK
jgi:regulatory protein YycI of two-component signal transduction system YycFG